MKTLNFFLLVFFSTISPLWAQEETSTDVAPDESASVLPVVEDITSQLNLQQIMESGGVILYVLAAMSVVALALVLTFLFTLNRQKIAPSGFVQELQSLLYDGDLTSARNRCEEKATPVSAIALAALDYLERAGDDTDPEFLRQVVEGEGIRQVSRYQSQITFLMDIGVIAPMVGLLGTVMGMLKSFSGVALNLAQARPQVLADGVSQALVTTAAGLIVAIPAMMFYSLFRGRLSKLTASLELVAADIVTTLAHRKPE